MAFPIRSIDFFLTRKSYRATLLKKNLEINSSYPKKKKKKNSVKENLGSWREPI